MSYGCLISVVNLTTHSVSLAVTLRDVNNWNDQVHTPAQLNGVTIGGNASSGDFHVELANDATSAEFIVMFSVDSVGTVETVANAYPVTRGGKRQGYLWLTGGTAEAQFWVLEAQYDKPNPSNWPQLSVIIMPKINPRTWMSSLNPDLQLNQLTIPGSHDTGTAPIVGIRQCQGLSISQQLNIGIRFLDIRLNKDYNFEIMHEDTHTGLWFFNDCLRPVIDFLAENGSETVLLCIKDEHGSTDHFHDDILAMLSRAAPTYICTDQVLPNLGKLRGKLVLLRRYWIDPNANRNKVNDANSGLGLHEFTDGKGNKYTWPDNSDTFDILKSDQDVFYQQPGGLPFAIQDWYDLQTSYQSDKVKLITKYLDIASTSLADTWFLNFTSCTASGHVADWPKNFAVGQDGINAALFTYLITHGKARYGIIPMDFVGNPPEEALVNLLINCNL